MALRRVVDGVAGRILPGALAVFFGLAIVDGVRVILSGSPDWWSALLMLIIGIPLFFIPSVIAFFMPDAFH